MQFTIVRDTLSKCIGDVSSAMDNNLLGDEKRKERMTKFMQFVLQEDYNVLAFEKVLVNSGLQDLLNFKTSEDVKKDSEEMQGIGILVLLMFFTLLVFTSYMLKFSYSYLSLFERISYQLMDLFIYDDYISICRYTFSPQ